MNYNSQFGQDKFIFEQVLKGQKKGFFLDIGASEPVNQNNTYYFEKLGWDGIVVEPRKEDFERLKKERSCICENVAISANKEIRKFLQVTGYAKGLSGILEGYNVNHLVRVVKEVLQFGGGLQLLDIDCVPISDLLNKHNVNTVDYLSIDVEGLELSILKTIEFDKVFIKCLTVENNYKNKEIESFLISNKFKKVAELSCDEVYVHE